MRTTFHLPPRDHQSVRSPLPSSPSTFSPNSTSHRLPGRFAGAEAGGRTTAFIRWFVGRHGVDMNEAANPRHRRRLQRFLHTAVAEPARSPRLILVPGRRCDQLFWCHRARPDSFPGLAGHCYSTVSASSAATVSWRPASENGSSATLYLSPRDYHRIHMPATVGDHA